MLPRGPIPIPFLNEMKEKYRERILATRKSTKATDKELLLAEIEQDYFDVAHAQGLPGQCALPPERIQVDLDAARQAYEAAAATDSVVDEMLFEAVSRAS